MLPLGTTDEAELGERMAARRRATGDALPWQSYARMPPSMLKSAPVTKLAAGDAR